MQGLIAKILEDSKQPKFLTPRQIFLQEFDRLLVEGATRESLLRLQQYGRAAGISEVEMTQRKNALVWSLVQAA